MLKEIKNKELAEAVTKALDSSYHSTSLKNIRRDINDPKWDEAHAYHDWRNYIPEEFKKIWFSHFDHAAKMAMYVIAEIQAGEENNDPDWDR